MKRVSTFTRRLICMCFLTLASVPATLSAPSNARQVQASDFASLVAKQRSLIAARNFDEARAMRTAHPDAPLVDVPDVRKGAPQPEHWPTALTVGASGKQMRRDAFKMDTPLRIVVVASSKTSQDIAHAIVADAQLDDLFSGKAIWLADQAEPFDTVEAWNRQFPDQQIHIAWQNGEWPMLDSWMAPTFYVFQNGKLARKITGWNGVSVLKASLHQAGAS